MIQLTQLFIYPVKSLAGFAVESADVDALGLVGDRRFMVVDDEGRFLTQRTLPRMALIRTSLSATTVNLSLADGELISVRRASDPSAPLRNVSVWKSEGLLAEDCGEAAAAWLSRALATRCRLVRIGEKFLRPILKANVAGPGENVTFADAFPFTVISTASFADLNDRLVAQGEDALPMDRFRPNLVVSGCPAFAEDEWGRFRIGAVTFHAGGPCARCSVTTTDQATAERGKEPLRTLATYRRDPTDPGDVNFGQNLVHETKSGSLRVGDPVEILA